MYIPHTIKQLHTYPQIILYVITTKHHFVISITTMWTYSWKYHLPRFLHGNYNFSNPSFFLGGDHSSKSVWYLWSGYLTMPREVNKTKSCFIHDIVSYCHINTAWSENIESSQRRGIVKHINLLTNLNCLIYFACMKIAYITKLHIYQTAIKKKKCYVCNESGQCSMLCI